MSYSKFIWGVHKKAQNSAVRAELGRPPLGMDIVANILLYEHHLKITKNELLKEASNVFQSIKCNQSWISKCEKIKLFLNENYTDKIDFSNRKLVKNVVYQKYVEYWKMKITTAKKMRTYITFKTHFQHENYLYHLKFNLRKSLTKCRISAHRLAIERGR